MHEVDKPLLETKETHFPNLFTLVDMAYYLLKILKKLAELESNQSSYLFSSIYES
jgi:hypothetical protein